jgi:hypothetical protein
MPETASAAVTELLTEAKEKTDALLGDWAARLEHELGGRHGEALA